MIAICHFLPEELAKGVWPQRGTPARWTWDRLESWLSSPTVTSDKAAWGGFAFADLRGGVRQGKHVISVSALSIEHDRGDVPRAAACALLKRYRHIAFSTWSHTPGAPRWRAVVAVSRPMLAEEYPLVWHHAEHHALAAGVKIDPSCKDGTRLWYSPTIRDLDASFDWCSCSGEALDVERVLVVAREREAREQAEHARAAAERADRFKDDRNHDRYSKGAARRAVDAVASASAGERHYTLGREAFSLARDELGLSDGEIESLLLPAFTAAAGDKRRREGERTIRDAIKARRRGAA